MFGISVIPETTVWGKISRYPLRLLPKNLVVPVLRGPARGKKWVIGSQRHAFWLGSYEPHMQNCIAAEVKPGGVFYDIGANVGFYTLLASDLVKQGKVVAFEPLTANVVYLKRHVQLNAVRNVEVMQLAICDHEGFSSFESEKTRLMGRLKADGACRVQTASLDSLLDDGIIAPPNYVKMDIEGAELQALLGGRTCFQRHKPILFLATHGADITRECGQLLQSWNFSLQYIDRTAEERAEILARPMQD